MRKFLGFHKCPGQVHVIWKGDPWALFSLVCTERRERHHLGDRVSAPPQLQASNGVTAQQQGSAQGGAGQ